MRYLSCVSVLHQLLIRLMDRNKNVEYVDKRVNKDIDQFQQLRNKRFILVHLDKKSIMSEYLSGRYYNFSLIQ
jgi:hypothetical protein